MIKDGYLVVMYDEILNCIINGIGLVKEYILEEVK